MKYTKLIVLRSNGATPPPDVFVGTIRPDSGRDIIPWRVFKNINTALFYFVRFADI